MTSENLNINPSSINTKAIDLLPINIVDNKVRVLTHHILDSMEQTVITDESMTSFMPWNLQGARDFAQLHINDLQPSLQLYVNTLCSKIKTVALEGLHGTGKTSFGKELAKRENVPFLKFSGYVDESEFKTYGITGVVRDLYGESLITAAREKDGERSFHTLAKVYFWYLNHEFESGKRKIYLDRGAFTRLIGWEKDKDNRRYSTPFRTEYSHPLIDSQILGSSSGFMKSDFTVTVPIPDIIYLERPSDIEINDKRKHSNDRNFYSYKRLADEAFQVLGPLDKMSKQYH